MSSSMSDNPASSHSDRASIHSGKPTYYPVETIPADVIRQILLHSLPAHGSVQPRRHSVPLVLAQICAPWREVALGTVQLWSSVDLTLRVSPSGASNSGIVQLLHTWFRRAKAHTLSLTARCPRERLSLPDGFLALIEQYAPQFRSLALSVPWLDWNKSIHSYSGPLPCLRRLSLHIAAPLGFFQRPALPAFDNMPQLEELRIHMRSEFARLRLRSRVLTTFELMGPATTADFEEIFRSLPNLRDLKVEDLRMQSVPQISRAHPLEALSINAAIYPDTLPHLRRLDVPLQNLQGIKALCNSISRSGCTILELTLSVGQYFDDTALTEVFQAVPLLTSLRVDFIGNFGFRTIYNVLASGNILPALRHLAIVESLNTHTDAQMARPSGHTPSCGPVFVQRGPGVTYPYGYQYDAVVSMLCARAGGDADGGAPKLESLSHNAEPTNHFLLSPNNPFNPNARSAESMKRWQEYGRAGTAKLESFSLTLQPTYHFLRDNNPSSLAAEAFIPYGAAAERIGRLREDGLNVRVRVPITGAPTICWPACGRGDDDEVPAFPVCEGEYVRRVSSDFFG